MSLDKATVARIATLARIKVADSDLDRMAGELQTIMRHTGLDRVFQFAPDTMTALAAVQLSAEP